MLYLVHHLDPTCCHMPLHKDLPVGGFDFINVNLASCRDAEEERYTFSSRLVGQTTPKRTNSLDSPAKGTAREWEDKGQRSSGERRTDNGPVRRALDVNRSGQGRVSMYLCHAMSCICAMRYGICTQ